LIYAIFRTATRAVTISKTPDTDSITANAPAATFVIGRISGLARAFSSITIALFTSTWRGAFAILSARNTLACTDTLGLASAAWRTGIALSLGVTGHNRIALAGLLAGRAHVALTSHTIAQAGFARFIFYKSSLFGIAFTQYIAFAHELAGKAS
jgi:hypothetical protein